MITRAVRGLADIDAARPALPDALPVEILESKLFAPSIRPGVVPRPRLLAWLRAEHDVPTVAVVAPAGYGKTTLLALWAETEERPFAWLSLDRHDNDPIVLLTHLAVALDRIRPLPGAVFDALRSGGASVPATVVPRLGAALAGLTDPLVLVVDDVHHLEDGASLDALVTLVDHIHGATQIALAGRRMPLPLARRRAQGRAVEIGTDDLAFTEEGARSLLRAAGADLAEEEVVALAHRTEGWAAGLYLAALSRTVRRIGAGPAFPDDDRLMSDYLQTELVSRLSPRDLTFLTRTAVLDRLCGPLCDAVLREAGSAAELEHLQRNNLFLVPLDAQGRWYRYHASFRDLLRARVEPWDARELTRRAAEWYETQGELETALHYAQDAEDADGVARLAVALARPMFATGRSATAMSWFEWLDERGAVDRHPASAALAAYLCALTGRPAAADRWADLAERLAVRVPPDDHGLFAMWFTDLQALLCRRGVEQMRRDVDDVGRVPGAGSAADVEYPVRLFLSGVARHLLDDADTAEARFTDATELTDESLRPPFFTATLAYRALLCVESGDWPGAESLVVRGQSVVDDGHARSHITSALLFAVAARLALHRRELTPAGALLSEAQRLRPLLSHATPWYSVETLLQMAEVSLGLGEINGARRFVRDAEAVLRRRPDLGNLGRRTDELRSRLGARRDAGADNATLTSAELRVLPLLLTHLTLAGMADRLFLSRHTVKSQVWSMYQKLGVHTRADAVTRAQELGLLEV